MGLEEAKNEVKLFPAFPYEPYSIQIDFMNALYKSLDRGGISMLQSPTGTGKTLSIICSALQWLVDGKKKLDSGAIDDSTQNRALENGCGSDEEPDWMRNFVANKDSQVVEKEKKKKKKHGLKSMKPHKKSNQIVLGDSFSHREDNDDTCKEKSAKKSNEKIDYEKFNDDEFLVEEYESDDDVGHSKRKSGGVSISSSSEGEKEGDSSDDEDDNEAKLKIYFCSRTHSQLSQFIKELKKTVFASQLKVICLGSRKNFCINEDVLRLGSSTRINERCLELQKKKKNAVSKTKILGDGGRMRRTKASSGCPMLKKYKLQKQFKSDIYEEGAMDIEDIVRLGSKIGTCPYYGSRSVVPAADLVVLPYQSLLSKSSRESLGLNLKDSIVIIDEAHNLADSLIGMYNSKLTFSQLERADSQLKRYFERFRTLLGPGNRRYIQTLMVFTRAFLKILHIEASTVEGYSSFDAEEVPRAKNTKDCSMAINEFLFSLNIDNINLVKLLRYVKESNIIHKVSGYGDKVASLTNGSKLTNGDDTHNDEGSKLASFQALVDLLLSLTHNDGDGRIIISRKPLCPGQEEGYIKYVMLTGQKIFSEIADQAHAVVLAGGTLQPTEETRERLFPWLSQDQLHFFSCSHIVPSESILPIAVSQGPSGQSFDFSFGSRSSPSMIGELGLLLCNLVTVIPEGIVVFFSSFDYEGQVYDAWKTSGILARIAKKKQIFREPRKNTDVDLVLKNYENAIHSSCNGGSQVDPTPRSGAILLAVVGGKISEGINFSDGMGRCVIMVGLPYPSPSDIELIERIKHIEGLKDGISSKPPDCIEFHSDDVRAGFDILRSCKRRGKEYYENLCMKAVNQSIGRAIRHVNDYAAILLVDSRYASDPSNRSFNHPTTKLPEWIKASFVSRSQNYGEVHRLLHKFFKFNKTRPAP